MAGTGSLMFDLSARSVGGWYPAVPRRWTCKASGHSLRAGMAQGPGRFGRQPPRGCVRRVLLAFLTGEQSTLPQPLWHREREAPWWEPPSYWVVTEPLWVVGLVNLLLRYCAGYVEDAGLVTVFVVDDNPNHIAVSWAERHALCCCIAVQDVDVVVVHAVQQSMTAHVAVGRLASLGGEMSGWDVVFVVAAEGCVDYDYTVVTAVLGSLVKRRWGLWSQWDW